MSRPPNPWLPLADRTPDPAVRLFCFAHAGGSAALYRSWPGVSPAVAIHPVQLPGHGHRLGEAPLASMAAILDGLEEWLAPLLDRPFALFGHSMGSWVAYAAARRLRTRDGRAARHLFVSGAVPPLAAAPPGPPRSDGELAALLRRLGGTAAPLLANAELMALALPVFAADLGVMDGYRPDVTPLLDCPVTAFTGAEDPLHAPEELDAWQGVTKGSFDRSVFPGGHFYLESLQGLFPRLIEDCLRRHGNDPESQRKLHIGGEKMPA